MSVVFDTPIPQGGYSIYVPILMEQILFMRLNQCYVRLMK